MASLTDPFSRVSHNVPFGSYKVGTVVNCKPNPYDLRPAVAAILEAIDARRKTLAKGQKIVVLMGEEHATSSHILLQLFLIDALRKRGERFTVSIEQPHNLWKYNKALPDAGYIFDPAAACALSKFLAFYAADVCPVSHRKFYQYLLNNKNLVVFSDAARKESAGKRFLDQADPITRLFIQRHASNQETSSQKEISTGPNSPGTKIRNHMIVDLTLGHANRHEADLVIFCGGSNHILGYDFPGFPELGKEPYSTSLTSLFKQVCALPIPVMPESYLIGFQSSIGLEHDALRQLESSIYIGGMKKDKFGEKYQNELLEDLFIKNVLEASEANQNLRKENMPREHFKNISRLNFRKSLRELDLYNWARSPNPLLRLWGALDRHLGLS